MYYTDNLSKDTFVPTRFESDGEIILHGETVKYHTVSEDNVFYKDGKPIASIYSYSYFRTDVKDVDSRPVLFCFNGGPGTSSVYVHAGFLAPKRVKYKEGAPVTLESSLPPYEVID